MFGDPPLRKGYQFQGPSTDVPVAMMSQIKMKPLPITIGGTSGRTFTLNASVTNPAAIWNGDDFIYLTWSVAYSWVVGTTNSILHATTGAETTMTNSTAGVWYMYLNKDGTEIFPSATKPSFVEAPNNSGYLGHPGTAKTERYVYVGFMLCDATTPTFITATKKKDSYVYTIAEQALACAADSAFAAIDGSLVLPAHGVEVGGYMETNATASGVTSIGDSSTENEGSFQFTGDTLGNARKAPFFGLVPDSNGYLWGKTAETSNSEVNILRIRDVV